MSPWWLLLKLNSWCPVIKSSYWNLKVLDFEMGSRDFESKEVWQFVELYAQHVILYPVLVKLDCNQINDIITVIEWMHSRTISLFLYKDVTAILITLHHLVATL